MQETALKKHGCEPHPDVALQLYSVRSLLRDRFKETLQALAGIGFGTVEFAHDFGAMEPEVLADFLQGIGLRAGGLFSSAGAIADPRSATYRYARALGCEFVSLGVPLTPDNVREQAAHLLTLRRTAADQGLTLTYHNHAYEFQQLPDGRTLLEALCDETAAEGLQFELDVFFAHATGHEPCALLERFRGRVPQIHFNDLERGLALPIQDGKACMQRSTELGTGCLDLPAIRQAAEATGVRLIVLEQHTLRANPLDSVRTNWDYLRNLGAV